MDLNLLILILNALTVICFLVAAVFATKALFASREAARHRAEAARLAKEAARYRAEKLALSRRRQ